MKYTILCLVLLSSAAWADAAPQADDREKAPDEEVRAAPVPEGFHRTLSTVQGNLLPGTGRMAVAPSEFLSAPQYQPQPLQQNGPPLLYSLNPR